MADNLVSRVTLDALGTHIPAADPSFWIEDEDRVVCHARHQQVERLDPLAHLHLPMPAFGNVLSTEHNVARRRATFLQQRHRAANPTHSTGLHPEAHDDPKGAALPFQHLLSHGLVRREILGMDQGHAGFGSQLGFVQADHLPERRVGADKPALKVGERDADRCRVDDRAQHAHVLIHRMPPWREQSERRIHDLLDPVHVRVRSAGAHLLSGRARICT